MLNLDIAPMLFEVFGDEAAVAVIRRFLAAKEAASIQDFARCSFDMPRPH
jgi:hypothetical protein